MRFNKMALILSTGLLVLSVTSAQDASDSSYEIPAGTPDNIRAAIESGARSAAERARDAGRKPAEVLTLAGIETGDEVIELASFGHYYTRMLVEAVGPQGHVYMFDMPWTDPFGGEAARAFDADHENASYHQVHYNEADFPQNVDVVTNVLFYHDLVQGDVDRAALNAKLFDALEPGGTYLIVDHKADDGTGWRDAATTHRIGIEVIRQEVTAAGFVLAIESNMLANADDDHTGMVRTPELRGKTDRAVLVFKKPR
jgi:predicted methyltransferase